jgi:uncharacterized membrane protein
MNSRRWALGLLLTLWAVMIGRIISVWPRLPERMAAHFNARGQADGWMSRDGFVLFWLGISGALTLLLFTLASWIPWAIFNVPNRHYWSDPVRQPLARRRMAVWCAWFAVGLNLLLVSVLELVLRANLMSTPHLSSSHAALLVGYMVLVGVMLVVLFRLFRLPRQSAPSRDP